MIEHTTSQVDKETRMEVLLSECSFNQANLWLTRKGFVNPEKVESDTDFRFTTLTFTSPVKKKFVYEEKRGYLLGE